MATVNFPYMGSGAGVAMNAPDSANPIRNAPTSDGQAQEDYTPGIDLTPYYNLFGFNTSPAENSGATANGGAGNPMGFFNAIIQWIQDNPGMALLLGALTIAVAGNTLSRGFGLSGMGSNEHKRKQR